MFEEKGAGQSRGKGLSLDKEAGRKNNRKEARRNGDKKRWFFI
jgi:hypothetical protein